MSLNFTKDLEQLQQNVRGIRIRVPVIREHLNSIKVITDKNHKKPQLTQGSKNASDGIKVETIFCSQPSIIPPLEKYFNKTIKSIVPVPSIPSKKKSDVHVEFEDNTRINIQIKNGKIVDDGRGHSVDRRECQLFSQFSPDLEKFLGIICLKKEGERSINIDKTISQEVVNRCILGMEESTKPNYFAHTVMNDNNVIESLGISTADDFMKQVHDNLYANMVSKITCVHLSPNIYFQRKGGTKSESRPNHIQMKLKLTNHFATIFRKLL